MFYVYSWDILISALMCEYHVRRLDFAALLDLLKVYDPPGNYKLSGAPEACCLLNPHLHVLKCIH